MPNVLSIILGGGKGTRLYPLTKERAKPAVSFGGRYRLVDIPISNCINSNLRQIYVLTQFNSASLNAHIGNTYNFDSFSGGFVHVLAAEQTNLSSDWYMGTADAVRKNFPHFRRHKPSHYLILSGDQLYRMNLKEFLDRHINSGADISIASTPVTREDTVDLGILSVNEEGLIDHFLEKPEKTMDIDKYKIPTPLLLKEAPEKEYLASMGIYFFSAHAMEKCLNSKLTDFGKEIIPEAIETMKVRADIYTGYWEDIGTIKNFFEANIDLSSICPKFNLYDQQNPIYTHRRDLPPSKINGCRFINSLSLEGAIITNAKISHSIVGVRTIIDSDSVLNRCICNGADFYESPEEKEDNKKNNIPHVGIGEGAKISNTIIDKNARIGKNCLIGQFPEKNKDGNYGDYHIVDGIIIIHKDAIIPNNTMI